jgi:hypothetical protein
MLVFLSPEVISDGLAPRPQAENHGDGDSKPNLHAAYNSLRLLHGQLTAKNLLFVRHGDKS